MRNDPTLKLNPNENGHVYLCIDLKSFYASVECVDLGLDPMTTDLVVADPERTDKTICLAASPAMKAKGVRNRCRVFEIPKHINYIMTPPRMQRYIDKSAEIYGIYLKYIAREDIHVYSIDECFLDVTAYLTLYGISARQLAVRIMDDVASSTGLRAACGIGGNLFLAKVALDITAKHARDFIGFLDEETYRRTLWQHQPITDFWQIGSGIAQRLDRAGIRTMEGIAKADEERLFKLFGVNAELLIDHAWGREPTTIADIKGFKTKSSSLSRGQVLPCDYAFEKGLLIVKEMMDLLCLDLSERELITRSVTLVVGYARSNGAAESSRGTASLLCASGCASMWLPEIEKVYRRIVRPDVPIRRVTLGCNDVQPESTLQYTLFDDPERLQKTRRLQKTLNTLHHRYGKNSVLRGMNYQTGATTIERNGQIGGHRSGAAQYPRNMGQQSPTNADR